MVTLGVLLWPGGPFRQSLGLLTDIRKTFTPWSSVSMAVMRMLFSLALSICIWAHSLVLRISRRLPWVRITATNEATQPWPLTPSNSQLGEQTHLAGKRTPRATPRPFHGLLGNSCPHAGASLAPCAFPSPGPQGHWRGQRPHRRGSCGCPQHGGSPGEGGD